jgi:hypothetical protein
MVSLANVSIGGLGRVLDAASLAESSGGVIFDSSLEVCIPSSHGLQHFLLELIADPVSSLLLLSSLSLYYPLGVSGTFTCRDSTFHQKVGPSLGGGLGALAESLFEFPVVLAILLGIRGGLVIIVIVEHISFVQREIRGV